MLKKIKIFIIIFIINLPVLFLLNHYIDINYNGILTDNLKTLFFISEFISGSMFGYLLYNNGEFDKNIERDFAYFFTLPMINLIIIPLLLTYIIILPFSYINNLTKKIN